MGSTGRKHADAYRNPFDQQARKCNQISTSVEITANLPRAFLISPNDVRQRHESGTDANIVISPETHRRQAIAIGSDYKRIIV